MQKEQDYYLRLRWKGSASRTLAISCGLLFCLTTGVFATDERVDIVTPTTSLNASLRQVGKQVVVVVMDDAGPVVGANVVVKGTTIGNPLAELIKR